MRATLRSRPPEAANTPDGRKVKATLHWVSAEHAVDAEVRLYDTLFTVENPDDVPEGQDFAQSLNPGHSRCCRAASSSRLWPGASRATRYQFERLGYFCADHGRLPPGRSGVQPHGHAERHLGQDREEAGRGLGVAKEWREAALAARQRAIGPQRSSDGKLPRALSEAGAG